MNNNTNGQSPASGTRNTETLTEEQLDAIRAERNRELNEGMVKGLQDGITKNEEQLAQREKDSRD